MNETTKKTSFLTKVTLVLLGILVTTFIFALFTKQFEITGIYLALILCIILSFCGLYYIEKGTKLRLVTWGMISAIVMMAGIYISGLIYIQTF